MHTLRMMMREEFVNGIQELEKNITSNIGAMVDELRAELVEEKLC